MSMLKPDACGATARHQRIYTCAECHGARVLKRPQGMRDLQYCECIPASSIYTVFTSKRLPLGPVTFAKDVYKNV